MTGQILDAPFSNEQSPKNYAGFWIRFAAYLIDAIILWIIGVILSYIILGGYSLVQESLLLTALQFVVGISYFVVLESSAKQGTLGKIVVGLKVGDEHGNQISAGTAVGRYFSKILSAIILLIGFMMVGWDDRKQGLHDKIMGTYVYYN
ncbi:RDD family protein [Chryseotalea sanaruensis]|uniref:RDD family protein n=1 Tax=Chryseotalea sanaruensis TaxID=2482724 RepID=A0A401UAW3_9BACT|nr:RDD family protein [Chryseotalea sanaruensis]GCC52027.1 RDD family protein [Chryseotalea sanaruensis]